MASYELLNSSNNVFVVLSENDALKQADGFRPFGVGRGKNVVLAILDALARAGWLEDLEGCTLQMDFEGGVGGATATSPDGWSKEIAEFRFVSKNTNDEFRSAAGKFVVRPRGEFAHA